MSKQTIEEIDINNIMADEAQPRRNIKDEGIATLKESISAHGLIYPLVVRKGDDDKYKLIDGERRFRALKSLGTEKVNCVVLTIDNPVEISYQQLIANIVRDDLPPLDYCSFIFRLVSDLGESQKNVALKINKSESHISRAMKIGRLMNEDDLPEKVVDLIDKGHLKGLSSIYAALLFHDEKGEEQFEKEIDEHLEEQRRKRKNQSEEDSDKDSQKTTKEGAENAEEDEELDDESETESDDEASGNNDKSESISRRVLEEKRAKNLDKPQRVQKHEIPTLDIDSYISYHNHIVKVVDVEEDNNGSKITIFCEKDSGDAA